MAWLHWSNSDKHTGLDNPPYSGFHGKLGRRLLKTLREEYPDGRDAVIIMTRNDAGGRSWQTWLSAVAWEENGSGQDWAWQGQHDLNNYVTRDKRRGTVTLKFPSGSTH